MVKKYIVTLTSDEREELQKITKKGQNPAYKINHARILLKADTSQADGGWTDQAIASALELSISTIEKVRQRFVELGVEAALGRKEASRRKAKCLDGEQEAYLIAMVCSEPPYGRGRWTLRLLADTMISWGKVEKISHETVRQTLKKTNLSLI